MFLLISGWDAVVKKPSCMLRPFQNTPIVWPVSRYSVENLSERSKRFNAIDQTFLLLLGWFGVCSFSLSAESTLELPAAQHLRVICLNKRMWRINHNNAAILSCRLSVFAEVGAFGVSPHHLFACQKLLPFSSFFPPLTHL